MAAEKCHSVGRKGFLACHQPPSHAAVRGSVPELLQLPSARRIRASPQMPQGGQVSASARPQEAVPALGSH